jgi:hypothetical protein
MFSQCMLCKHKGVETQNSLILTSELDGVSGQLHLQIVLFREKGESDVFCTKGYLGPS